MAFVVLSSLSQTLNQILNHDQYPISAYGKQQIASLHQQVLFLLDFLKKSDEKGNSLETRMRDAANEAEDIIEHFMYEQIRYKKSMAATSILYDLSELKIVMEEINSIAQEAMERSHAPPVESLPSSSAMLAPTHVDSFTVGLDEDLKKIIYVLLEDSHYRETIAITGMGGIGKTTLARNAYNHDLVQEHFHVRAWLTLSHDYKMDNILSHLEDCLNFRGTKDGSEMERMYIIQRFLFERKYLIVLDDIWSTDAWNFISRMLPEDSFNGSRIMITTRQKLLLNDMVMPYHHEVRFLDENHSWILLKQKVFPNKECPPGLEKIGKDIGKRCGGLPLAIILAADVLSTTPPHSWKKVAENVSAAIAEPFDKVMSSSYLHLPHHLRPCFLYMGGFPEDYEIRVSNLTKLWIGEGFVGPRSGKSLEEVAELYLVDLVRRSLAFETKKMPAYGMKSCNVHDMIRGMCRRIAEDENSERRLSIACRDLRCVAKVYGSTIRSVTCFQPSDTSLKTLRKLRLMRVLDVVDTTATYFLPDQVFDLFHLRYLAFGCPMKIPAAISKLQNLRILIIRPSERLRSYSKDEVYLPLEVWRLPLLTVLISFFDVLPNPDGTAYVLDELLTLSVVKKLICTKELMKKIPNLKKLGITYFEDKYKQECQLQNLELLHHLVELKLVMRADSPVRLEIKPVFFPEILRKLSLSGWRWRWEDLETVGALPNLEVLRLRDHACQGHTWVTIEGQFQSLKYLQIDTSDLKVWEIAKYSNCFRKLERLALYRCSLLSEIPYEVVDRRTLKVIEVDYANEDLVQCVKRIQKERQEIWHDLQVSIGA